MMRSKRQKSRGLSELFLDHPLFCMAVIAGLSFIALYFTRPEADSGLYRLLSLLWETLGFGFEWMGNLLDSVLPGLENSLRVAFVSVTGLLPYLVGDFLWQRLRLMVSNRQV